METHKSKIPPFLKKRKLAGAIFGLCLIVLAVTFIVKNKNKSPDAPVAENLIADTTVGVRDIVFLPVPDEGHAADITAALDSSLQDALMVLGVDPANVKVAKKTGDSGLPGIPKKSISVRFSSAYPTALANYIFCQSFLRHGCEIVKTTELNPGRLLNVTAGQNGFTVFDINIERTSDFKPLPSKVSVIYIIEPSCRAADLATLLALNVPASFAVSPADPSGTDFIKMIKAKKRDLILALPFSDAGDNKKIANSDILPTMSEQEIKSAVKTTLAKTPGVYLAVNRGGFASMKNDKITQAVKQALLGTGIKFITGTCDKDAILSETPASGFSAGGTSTKTAASELYENALLSRLSPAGGIILVHVGNSNAGIIKESIISLQKTGIEFIPAIQMIERKASWQSKQQKSTSI